MADVAAILSPLPDRKVKWRTWKRVPPTELILDQSESGPLVYVARAEPAKVSTDDRVLAYLDAGADAVDAIEAVSGLSRSTIYSALKDLRRAGLVAKGSPLRRLP